MVDKEFNLSQKIWNDEKIYMGDVKKFIKEERKVLDNWCANLKRDEIGGREIGIEDLLRLSKKLDALAGDALVSSDENILTSKQGSKDGR